MTLTGKNLERLHPAFRQYLEDLSRRTGVDINAYSTGRTDEEQEVLYKGYLNRLSWHGGYNDPNNPYLSFNPANPPGGKSRHRYVPGKVHAQAADISPNAYTLGWNPSGPLHFPYQGGANSYEPWHIEPESILPEVPFTDQEDDLNVPTIRPDADQGHSGAVQGFVALSHIINPTLVLDTPEKIHNALIFLQTTQGLVADGWYGPKTVKRHVEIAYSK